LNEGEDFLSCDIRLGNFSLINGFNDTNSFFALRCFTIGNTTAWQAMISPQRLVFVRMLYSCYFLCVVVIVTVGVYYRDHYRNVRWRGAKKAKPSFQIHSFLKLAFAASNFNLSLSKYSLLLSRPIGVCSYVNFELSASFVFVAFVLRLNRNYSDVPCDELSMVMNPRAPSPSVVALSRFPPTPTSGVVFPGAPGMLFVT
jgi:hypothetical protein